MGADDEVVTVGKMRKLVYFWLEAFNLTLGVANIFSFCFYHRPINLFVGLLNLFVVWLLWEDCRER